jgi:hypothetical protein
MVYALSVEPMKMIKIANIHNSYIGRNQREYLKSLSVNERISWRVRRADLPSEKISRRDIGERKNFADFFQSQGNRYFHNLLVLTPQ